MNTSKYIFLLLLFLTLSHFGYSQIERTPIETFGILDDKTFEDYIERARNHASSSEDLPDLSPVVCFTFNLKGKPYANYIGSGVLITPEWVLTAAHNFYYPDEQKYPAPPDGIWAEVGYEPGDYDNQIVADRVVYHPTWIEDNEDLLNANDLCLVHLS